MHHQRRLSGTVGPQQGHALAMPDAQVDPAQGGLSARVVETKPPGVDRAAHGAPARTRIGISNASTAAIKAASRAARPTAPVAAWCHRSRGPPSPAARAHHDHGFAERAQLKRGQRARLERVSRPVALREQGSARARDLPDQQEEVAVHERGDQDHHPRRAHSLQPRSIAGTGVVAASRTAERVPIEALTMTLAITATPAS